MKKPFEYSGMEIEGELCDTFVIRSDDNNWFAIYFTMSDAEKAYTALNRADLFDELAKVVLGFKKYIAHIEHSPKCSNGIKENMYEECICGRDDFVLKYLSMLDRIKEMK